jgi:pyruvate ferredoxin oxidoreductase gamma subunit
MAIELRFHGRGGQGTVTLAALFADAAFGSGWHVLAYPAFGTERTGAPVAAFARVDRKPIFDRGQVRNPRIVVCQDPTLVGAIDVLDGLEPGGVVVINSERPLVELEGVHTVAIPATALARKHLGVTVTSTAMLGAVAAATDLIDIDAVCTAITNRFSGDMAERNVALARAAHDTVVRGEEAA